MSKPITKGARLTGEQRAELTERMVAMYEKGASIRDIAAETNRAFGSVHRLLAKAGVLRPRGGDRIRRVTRPRELTPAEAREYAERLRQRKVK